EAARNAGGRDVTLVDEPVAAAVGAGLDIEAPLGCMIVDIGGGTTEVAALSLGGIVAYRSLRVGGSHLDEAIMEYVRKKHNVMIGERTAEELKIKVGCVYPQPEETRMAVRGRDLFGGLPTLVEVTSSDICQALKEPMQAIVAAVRQTLEQTPPELSGDIMQNGLVISGGSAGLVGLEVLMKEAVRIPVSIADTPQECVALGAGLLIDSMLHNYRAQRRQM
ncbi:MAG: rod shape-determining protein, partial [Clostridia bacterium]|nr:rod shape-determining protein [Clostridia bacterium]